MTIMNGTVPHAICSSCSRMKGSVQRSRIGAHHDFNRLGARVLCANLSAAGPDHRRGQGLAANRKGANTSARSLGLPLTRWDTTTRSGHRRR